MKFLAKWIRPIYAYPVGLVYALVYSILYIVSKNHCTAYKNNKIAWDSINDFAGLVDYFKKDFKYNYDGPLGIIDHVNFGIEFFIQGGDCDDMAYWACKKMREIGMYARVVFVYGNGIQNWHFDCLFDQWDDFYLKCFNFGRPIEFNSELYAEAYGWKKPCKFAML
jgi:hypothetical protein